MIKQSVYKKSIKTLIETIFSNTPLNDSVYEAATDYFKFEAEDASKKNEIEQGIFTAKQELAVNPKSAKLMRQLKVREKSLKELNFKQNEARQNRLDQIKKVCHDIAKLCLGKSEADEARKYAKMLGTIQLLTPIGSTSARNHNKKSKHLYRAVLTLLLFDTLIADKKIKNTYIEGILSRATEEEGENLYLNEVQIPILMSAILMDIGQYHPDVLNILHGENRGLDEFRVLEKDERINALKIKHHQTIHYFKHGLGESKYVGNNREQRAVFQQTEKDKMAFIISLLKSSLVPKQSIGNVLKVPQAYTSVVLSTHKNYTYKSLPRVFPLLNRGAELGNYSQMIVNVLQNILGTFPQGFGITYIPKDPDGCDLDRFEYAIVKSLYPENPDEPLCRIATKNLTYKVVGNDSIIKSENNLFFPDCRKKLKKVSNDRLQKILEKLWSDFETRQGEANFVPDCWEPHEYFTNARYQNLWNKNPVGHN